MKSDVNESNGVHPTTVLAVMSPLLNSGDKSDVNVDGSGDTKSNADVKGESSAEAKVCQENTPSISFVKPEQVGSIISESYLCFYFEIQ